MTQTVLIGVLMLILVYVLFRLWLEETHRDLDRAKLKAEIAQTRIWKDVALGQYTRLAYAQAQAADAYMRAASKVQQASALRTHDVLTPLTTEAHAAIQQANRSIRAPQDQAAKTAPINTEPTT